MDRQTVLERTQESKKLRRFNRNDEPSTRETLPASFGFRTRVETKRMTPRRHLGILEKPLKTNVSSKKRPRESESERCKSSEKELQECPICLNAISEPSGILSCNHKFCFTCIHLASSISTKCPCCRNPIMAILKGKESVRVAQIVHDQEQFLNDDDYLENPCYFCDTFDNIDSLILCDRCTNYCVHVYCDPSLNRRMPTGDWICMFCRQTQENERAILRQMRDSR